MADHSLRRHGSPPISLTSEPPTPARPYLQPGEPGSAVIPGRSRSYQMHVLRSSGGPMRVAPPLANAAMADPDDGAAQEAAGLLPDAGIRRLPLANFSPHPADHDQVREEHEDKASSAARPPTSRRHSRSHAAHRAPTSARHQTPKPAASHQSRRGGTPAARVHGRAPSTRHQRRQRQHEAQRDDAGHQRVVEPEPRQAQVGEPTRRDVAGAARAGSC